ncbi:MAG: type II toxin-antitoxin system prevent-host-death family antitoxin [Mycobacterium sp.]|nr:type II toxin-antitoxin system prevent-host-death family antitoxin [Mycobacterium sp.]
MESGEEITITVSGRPSVRMVPAAPPATWTTSADWTI